MLFTDTGPSEDDTRKPSVPAFLEAEPGSYKPLEACSVAEIESAIMSRTIQAQALIDEAHALGQYLDNR